MAARLTDWKKKKILADYAELGSYNATAKANGVSCDSVKRVVLSCEDFAKKLEQKKKKTPPIFSLTWRESGESCVRY